MKFEDGLFFLGREIIGCTFLIAADFFVLSVECF